MTSRTRRMTEESVDRAWQVSVSLSESDVQICTECTGVSQLGMRPGVQDEASLADGPEQNASALASLVVDPDRLHFFSERNGAIVLGVVLVFDFNRLGDVGRIGRFDAQESTGILVKRHGDVATLIV